MEVKLPEQLSKHRLKTCCYSIHFILLIKRKLIINTRPRPPFFQLREPASSFVRSGKGEEGRKATWHQRGVPRVLPIRWQKPWTQCSFNHTLIAFHSLGKKGRHFRVLFHSRPSSASVLPSKLRHGSATPCQAHSPARLRPGVKRHRHAGIPVLGSLHSAALLVAGWKGRERMKRRSRHRGKGGK